METFRKQKDEASGKRFILPSMNDEFEKYQWMTRNALTKEHSRISGRLSAYTLVNKKALDQLTNFIEEQEILLQRKEELADSFDSIVSLIEKLDEAKEKTLMSTFQRVNQHFGEVFAELIPQGRAKLILKRLSTEQIEEAEKKQQAANTSLSSRKRKNETSAEENRLAMLSKSNATVSPNPASSSSPFNSTGLVTKVESIVGIGIKVSFSGAEHTFYTMHQLSGGQKTVVALTLIFALQRCDPAPFYLFDEIDAALDDQYRSSVAHIIQKQSEMGAQFIMTTFRPQLIDNAEKLFKVTIRNRASAIEEISKEEAFSVVQETLAIEGVQEK
ncbi:RecF/RecN/SMC N terminal domain-containing protein [Cardiosporidium cionae]|uniref:RecF/RecN/SMC N terminal domain-containing protein n=1 Tax=Cardiosporidium cionae TaxID=476202 RepID=A0ABQ7JEV6_9APIC|nr:RecF/RecN/SMC N terminal domain-containing protein [Cardiosporidium cionae]|eukprot:KAF8822563.1 RecF/RecN/SMC N terminal domain-containing protein [Cardiosporidium cionae]